MGWFTNRAARRKALQVGAEVLTIVRNVVKTASDLSEARQEIARRVAESDFLSTEGLEAVRKIDEREAKWLEKLRGNG